MPDEPNRDPIDQLLDAALSRYAAVTPPPGAAARWRAGLPATPANDSFLRLSARAWAACCAACLAGLLVLGWIAFAHPAPAVRVVMTPPRPPRTRPAPQPAAVPRRRPRPPVRMETAQARPRFVLPAAVPTVAPTPQELILTRMVAQAPETLTDLLNDPALKQSAAKGETQ